MFKQTITLFRYQLLGIMNTRFMLLLLLVLTLAFLVGQFVAQLAIINSDMIALAVIADFLRYSLVLLLIISLSHQVSQDFELNQFHRLLAMPLSRFQYVQAQFLLLVVLTLILMLPVFLLILLLADMHVALYWSLACCLELLLVGQFTLLAIMSLEKLPLAVIFSLSVYLLSKASSLIDLILSRSSQFYNEEGSFQFIQFLFTVIHYVLPGASYFAQNNVFFVSLKLTDLLTTQFISVLVYSAFLQSVLLIDFYRKEFN